MVIEIFSGREHSIREFQRHLAPTETNIPSPFDQLQFYFVLVTRHFDLARLFNSNTMRNTHLSCLFSFLLAPPPFFFSHLPPPSFIDLDIKVTPYFFNSPNSSLFAFTLRASTTTNFFFLCLLENWRHRVSSSSSSSFSAIKSKSFKKKEKSFLQNLQIVVVCCSLFFFAPSALLLCLCSALFFFGW